MKSINGCYYCKCVCHLALCYLLLFVQLLVLVGAGNAQNLWWGKKNLSCLQEYSIFWLKLGFVCFSLSLRYQKAAEEATAEKKRSVSVLYKSIRLDHLHEYCCDSWFLLLWVLQKTWLGHRVCFCFTLCAFSQCGGKKRKWSFLPKAVLNHQFSPKWVNHKAGIPILAGGTCAVPHPFFTKFKSA